MPPVDPTQAAIHDPVSNPGLWIGFVIFMLVAMVVDLGVGKRNKAMSSRTALIWCGVWVTLALSFNVYLYFSFGLQQAEEFFAGYLLEYSLSVDNLFVFVLVFAYFRTPLKLQHRVLVWGIIGAMFLRATMILTGAALIAKFQWVMAIFGLFLVFTGFKLMFQDDDDDPTQSRAVQFLQKRLRLTEGYEGEAFWVYRDGKRYFTHLFLVLLVIEGSDVVFAVDSVPAIFGVTRDPFIVFTSNMFAILGLRSLFFAIAGAIQKLQYLNYGLSLVLSFIGLKMLGPFVPGAMTAVGIEHSLTAANFHLSTLTSLSVICTVLVATTILSLVASGADEETDAEGKTAEGETAEGTTAEGETAEGETAEGKTAEAEDVATEEVEAAPDAAEPAERKTP